MTEWGNGTGLCYVCSEFGFRTYTDKKYEYWFESEYWGKEHKTYYLCDDCRLYSSSLVKNKDKFPAMTATEGVLVNG